MWIFNRHPRHLIAFGKYGAGQGIGAEHLANGEK